MANNILSFRASFYLLVVLLSGVLFLSLTTNLNSYVKEHWITKQIARSMGFVKKNEQDLFRALKELDKKLSLRLLTYNIWFDSKDLDERMKALSELIIELKPHLIAMQEVNRFNLESMQKLPWYSLYKPYFSRENISKTNYFVAIFVLQTHEKNEPKWEALPTFESTIMDRNLVWVQTDVTVGVDGKQEVYKKCKFTLGTAHLESFSTLESSQRREKQLNEILVKQLNSFTDVCFTGDTNIDDVDGNVTLPSVWKDLWLVSGKNHEEGYTWGGSLNHYVDENSKQARYDRFICKLKNFELGEIKVVGNKPKELDDKKVFPSDHFGVFTTLVPLHHPLNDVVDGPDTLKFDRPEEV